MGESTDFIVDRVRYRHENTLSEPQITMIYMITMITETASHVRIMAIIFIHGYQRFRQFALTPQMRGIQGALWSLPDKHK